MPGSLIALIMQRIGVHAGSLLSMLLDHMPSSIAHNAYGEAEDCLCKVNSVIVTS